MCSRLDHASVVVVGCSDGGTSIIQLVGAGLVLVLLVLLVGVGVERGGCGVGWLGTLLGPEASGASAGLLFGGLVGVLLSWFRPCRLREFFSWCGVVAGCGLRTSQWTRVSL